jgi:beta-glucosidase
MPESTETRVEALLRQLTVEEKIAMTAGIDAWRTAAVPRLGIPSLKVTDGPNGARGGTFGAVTAACFPCGTAQGATWNPDLVREIGVALGQEARTKGARVLLAPTVNIHRHPLAGRNFECPSEDPYLTSRIAVAYVAGVQSQAVSATAKHFVCNDSEFERMTISSQVDERTLREVYLPPFEAAVKEGGAWAVMSAYNRINGTYAAEHKALLIDLLKDEWAFDGLVMSDWWGTHDTLGSANGGLDLEMPGPGRFLGPRRLTAAVESGAVTGKTLDDKVRRLLRLIVRTGAIDDGPEPAEAGVDLPEHRALIRRAAVEAMVLLRNESGILPLDAARKGLVAVIGPNGETLSIQAGGSSRVEPHHAVSLVQALHAREVLVRSEPGCSLARATPILDAGLVRNAEGIAGTAELFDGPDFEGDPTLTQAVRRMQLRWLGNPAPRRIRGQFSVRLRAVFAAEIDGPHRFSLVSSGLSRLFMDGELLIDNWTQQTRGTAFYGQGSSEVFAEVQLNAGEPHGLLLEYQSDVRTGIPGVTVGCQPPLTPHQMERAVDLAREAETVVLVVGSTEEWESEGVDRRSMALPGDQEELIRRVAAVNPRTIVVVNAGSPITMPWADDVSAIVYCWYPGQEGGDAIADVLYGSSEPGGRLPTTFPFRVEDHPSHLTYPGEAGSVSYGEGVFVGYRGFDRRGVLPRYPFGFGLSYTSFEYGPATLSRATIGQGESATVRFTVRNSGSRTGSEVAQVYVSDIESSLVRPEKELKGFAKVFLAPGETRDVAIELGPRAFGAWDVRVHDWVAEPGGFEILVGASSSDIRARATLQLE